MAARFATVLVLGGAFVLSLFSPVSAPTRSAARAPLAIPEVSSVEEGSGARYAAFAPGGSDRDYSRQAYALWGVDYAKEARDAARRAREEEAKRKETKSERKSAPVSSKWPNFVVLGGGSSDRETFFIINEGNARKILRFARDDKKNPETPYLVLKGDNPWPEFFVSVDGEGNLKISPMNDSSSYKTYRPEAEVFVENLAKREEDKKEEVR